MLTPTPIKEIVILNTVQFIVNICDMTERYKGMRVVRRYSDEPRPTGRSNQSCDNSGDVGVFAEINLDRLSSIKTCGSKIIDKDGDIATCVEKEYEARVDLDIIGCDAMTLAVFIADCLDFGKYENIRYEDEGGDIVYSSHGDIIDITALEESTHMEKVTMSLEFNVYTSKCEKVFTCEPEKDDCGEVIIPV